MNKKEVSIQLYIDLIYPPIKDFIDALSDKDQINWESKHSQKCSYAISKINEILFDIVRKEVLSPIILIPMNQRLLKIQKIGKDIADGINERFDKNVINSTWILRLLHEILSEIIGNVFTEKEPVKEIQLNAK